MTNQDLPLIESVKKIKEAHKPYTVTTLKGNEQHCRECRVMFPCISIKAYDALIRVSDLARFMKSPMNIGLDVESAAKELENAIKYEYSYDTTPVDGEQK